MLPACGRNASTERPPADTRFSCFLPKHENFGRTSDGTALANVVGMLRELIDGIRPDRFRPTHCPWPDCPAHTKRGPFRYRRYGFYLRSSGPNHKVPRFRCSTCRRTFSRQSFSFSYYLKRPELVVPVTAGLDDGSPARQIARNLGCAHSTVLRLSGRLNGRRT